MSATVGAVIVLSGAAFAPQPAEGSLAGHPLPSPSPQQPEAKTLVVNPRGLVMTLAQSSSQPVPKKATIPTWSGCACLGGLCQASSNPFIDEGGKNGSCILN